MPIDYYVAGQRLIATFGLSLLFGVTRQLSHKPIGFGTFTYVATGATALAIFAISMSPENPLPLLGAIVTGIGFLGAGALIKTGEKVAGFTSAALIWVFSVFGLAVGIGEYVAAGTLYVMNWIVTIYDRNLEKRGIGAYYRKITIVTNRFVDESVVRDAVFGKRKHSLQEVRGGQEKGGLALVYSVEGTLVHRREMMQILGQQEWCASYSIE